MEIDDKTIRHFSEFSSSTMKHIELTISKKLKKVFAKIQKYIRGNFLMKLYINEPDSDFFEVPSVPSLFQSVYTKSTAVFNKFPPIYTQNLIQKIQTIYSSPCEFSSSVNIYFCEDISDYLFFAYSTFPSLYSFFLTEEFCSSASSFLIFFFKCSKNRLISEALLTSFFASASVFYDHLWMILGNILFNFKYPTEFDNNIQSPFWNSFYEKILEGLKICLPLLSSHHIEAFNSFCAIFPEYAHKFILKRVLLEPFLTASESSTALVSSKGNRYFQQLIKLLINLDSNNKFNQKIINIIAFQKSFQEVIPSLSDFMWSHGVPLLFSQFDIKLLNNILNFSSLFSFKYNEERVKFSNSLSDLVSFNVYPQFCGKLPPQLGIGEQLFGESPPSFPQNKDDNDGQRHFRQLVKYVYDERLNLTEVILNPPKELAFINKTSNSKALFREYLLDLFHSNFVTIERTFLMQESLTKLYNLYTYVRSSTNLTFHHFSYAFLKNNIRLIQDIIPAIKMITKNFKIKLGNNNSFKNVLGNIVFQAEEENLVPFPVWFELLISALDTFNIVINDLTIELENDFESELINYMVNQWPKYNSSDFFIKRIQHIMKCSNLIAHISNCGYGKRLKIMLEFVKELKTIITNDNIQYWAPIFKYAIFASSQKSIFSTFMFLYYNISMGLGLDRQWSQTLQSDWSLFSAGIFSIIQSNKALHQKYSNLKILEDLFTCKTKKKKFHKK